MPALIISIFVAGFADAQTGDFSIKHSKQREYIRVNGNPFLKGNSLGRFFIGENYRKEWVDSITVPVLNFKTDYKGLIPKKEGGGKQTHTLHINDGYGNEWVLRSVQKFPEKVLSPILKGTIVEDMVYDGISASYPFSVLSVGTLAKAAGVPYFQNTLVYIPDEPALDTSRAKFKNTLALFEKRTIGNKTIEFCSTEEVIEKLKKDGSNTVDQKAVLKARLLDNFIMDFDRYEGQWEWMKKDSLGRSWYYPAPKDRDQAFFKGEGIIAKLISGHPAFGSLQGLRARPKNICTFNYSARNFDRSFLSEPDKQIWSNEIDRFLSAMSDDIITKALDRQPDEIQGYHSQKIIDILKKKREYFKKDMLTYYGFLSRNVSIVGTNGPEEFRILKNEDGSVLAEVINPANAVITYKRLFNPAETREIRIYGLGGNDKFWVSGATGSIKIRMIGGAGDDNFNNTSGKKKVVVYDNSLENNTVTGRFRKVISTDTLNNKFTRESNEYNTSSFGIHAQYSFDGGLFWGPGYKIITTGFRKEPYAGKQLVYVTKAFNRHAWRIHYQAEFIGIAHKTDLIVEGDAQLPTVRTNFFGWGNNTTFEKNKGPGFYSVQYNLVEIFLKARYHATKTLSVEFGPVAQSFHIAPKENSDKYFMTVYPAMENAQAYDARWFVGGEVKAIFNTKNNALIPTNGIYSGIYARHYAGISKSTNNVTQTGAVFSGYTDVLLKNHIVLATSFGIDHSFGSIELPQAQYLGFKQSLRGYRYQRFAGRTRAYNNSEVRINFGNLNLYLVKGNCGVIGFHDVGRVWMANEVSQTWHTGYGGGVWLAPYNKAVIAFTLATSKEENLLPMLTLGFQF